MFKAYLCGEQKEWDLYLGCLAGAYRATPNEATKMTPNLLTMGREVRLPGELVFGSTNSFDGEDIISYGDFVDVLRARMQHAHEIARKYLSAAAKRSKDLYDTKVAFHKYNEGDVPYGGKKGRNLSETRVWVRRTISDKEEAVRNRFCNPVRQIRYREARSPQQD